MLKKTCGFSIIINVSKHFNLGLRLTGSTNNDKHDSERSTHWNNKLSVSNSMSRLNHQQSSGIKTKEALIFKNEHEISAKTIATCEGVKHVSRKMAGKHPVKCGENIKHVLNCF